MRFSIRFLLVVAVLAHIGCAQAPKALARDPRVVLTVDLEAPPYAFVQVQGTVSVSENPDELVASATEIAARYVGPERAEAFGKRNGVPGELLVKITPTKVLAHMDMTA